MKYIEAQNYKLEIGSIVNSSLNELLNKSYSTAKKVIIVDENTNEHCLDALITNFDALKDAEIILLPVGEENKQLFIAQNVWEALTEYGVGRYDLIINLGGGVITDMGGFIASCYKRGCDFINIPTSLLAMVDASLGGKTGVNLGYYKNQIGVFSNPVALYIDPSFLETLPDEEYLSGFAEMLKHGLIADKQLFTDVVKCMDGDLEFNEELLIRCIEIKNKVVLEDPTEKGLRKTLNFGHTIGHAIEGFYMEDTISHGHAVAIGMVMEAYISTKKTGLSEDDYMLIENSILGNYGVPKFSDEDIQEMIKMLKNDKKNSDNEIKCCLLSKIGVCTYDHSISEKLFLETFLHFKNKQIILN
ncbi:MAG: 3-dehydroquinate synthase [Crocinitomicaceae bacterium]